ncbi:hypothetical protein OE88DRAFT_1646336 [Heliocybe sulcata]|uniref:Uncharacterized protein n=1 Tax=Heliocybe sulcata TaxID=5364 RepID=A0A5C3MWM7_9AGAM|nr:hypothetical protein OE88DRAFT_1646336 [Heliocybe sulcata]
MISSPPGQDIGTGCNNLKSDAQARESGNFRLRVLRSKIQLYSTADDFASTRRVVELLIPSRRWKRSQTIPPCQPPSPLPAACNSGNAWYTGAIDFEEGLKWANRYRASIGEELLEPGIGDSCKVLLTLDRRIKELGGVGCAFSGRQDSDGSFHALMVVTRSFMDMVPYADGKWYLTRKQGGPGPDRDAAKRILREEGVQWKRFRVFPLLTKY